MARQTLPIDQIQDPPFLRTLLQTPRFAWLWTIVRLYVGWSWLSAGWGKLSNPAWMQTGAAVKGFWTQAVTVSEDGASVIEYEWFRSFLQFLLDGNHYTWMSKLIVFGEVFVGLGLILGAFVGFAAFFGGLMNFNFMLAGSASTNPVLFFLSILLVLAWKVAGYYGIDRWLLPMLGTPWQRPIDSLKVDHQV